MFAYNCDYQDINNGGNFVNFWQEEMPFNTPTVIQNCDIPVYPANIANQDAKRQMPRKRFRTCFTTDQLTELEKQFVREKYLNRTKKIELARSLQLSEQQVKVWFQNKRTKYRKQINKEIMFKYEKSAVQQHSPIQKQPQPQPRQKQQILYQELPQQPQQNLQQPLEKSQQDMMVYEQLPERYHQQPPKYYQQLQEPQKYQQQQLQLQELVYEQHLMTQEMYNSTCQFEPQYDFVKPNPTGTVEWRQNIDDMQSNYFHSNDQYQFPHDVLVHYPHVPSYHCPHMSSMNCNLSFNNNYQPPPTPQLPFDDIYSNTFTM